MSLKTKKNVKKWEESHPLSVNNNKKAIIIISNTTPSIYHHTDPSVNGLWVSQTLIFIYIYIMYMFFQ